MLRLLPWAAATLSVAASAAAEAAVLRLQLAVAAAAATMETDRSQPTTLPMATLSLVAVRLAKVGGCV